MADTFISGWQRESLYYTAQDAWGVADSGAGFRRIRETSKSVPYAPPPVIVPSGFMGRGLPFAASGDFSLGRPGGEFSSTHPATVIGLIDMFTLLYQANNYAVTDDNYLSPVNASNVVIWDTKYNKIATVVVRHAASGNRTAQLATSALIKTIGLTIPAAVPGQTSGTVEMNIGWIAETLTSADSHTVTSPTDDTATAYLNTKDFIFEIGGSARDFVSATLTYDNGAALEQTAAATAPGATIGPLVVTGSIVVLHNVDTAATGATVDDLMDALEGKTALDLSFVYASATANEISWDVPAIITGPPAISDIGGINAWTFNFTTAGSTTKAPKIFIEDQTTFQAGLFYVAP